MHNHRKPRLRASILNSNLTTAGPDNQWWRGHSQTLAGFTVLTYRFVIHLMTRCRHQPGEIRRASRAAA